MGWADFSVTVTKDATTQTLKGMIYQLQGFAPIIVEKEQPVTVTETVSEITIRDIETDGKTIDLVIDKASKKKISKHAFEMSGKLVGISLGRSIEKGQYKTTQLSCGFKD